MISTKENPAANRVYNKAFNSANNTKSFAEINSAAMSALPSLLTRWLPDGKLRGQEYTARNPKRADRCAGSFKVNVQTGRWADFATRDKGGDIISLAAYLSGKGQGEAARELARMLGVRHV